VTIRFLRACNVHFGRPARRASSDFAARDSPLPVQVPTSAELAPVFVREQTRLRQVLRQGKSGARVHCRHARSNHSVIVSAGDTRHTVRVAATRDEILYHHRATHRLHGRSIPGEWNNARHAFPKRLQNIMFPFPIVTIARAILYKSKKYYIILVDKKKKKTVYH